MATHSSVLAWRIPGMAEPGGLLPVGSHRVGHDWSDLAAAAANSREGTQLHPPTENWIKDFLSMAPPIWTRPSIPLSLSIPSGSFHKPFYPSPSEGRQTENYHHRKLTNIITWTTALSNSVKLWSMPCRATKMDRSWCRVLAKCGPLEKGMANHFSIPALRTSWTVWKDKKIWHWNMNSPGW